MAFTPEQLQKFAHLIRLDVTEQQLTDMKIDAVIDWLDKLQQIDTTGIEPMLTPVEHGAPMRDDVVTDGDMRDDVLANAPDKTGASRGYFAVPKVMD